MAQLPSNINIDFPFQTADRVRVLRVLEYEGPREVVEMQLSSSIQGTRLFAKGRCRITAVTLDQFPQILEAGRKVADPRAIADLENTIDQLRMERNKWATQAAEAREELSRMDAELRTAHAKLGEAQEALGGTPAEQPALATQEELEELGYPNRLSLGLGLERK